MTKIYKDKCGEWYGNPNSPFNLTSKQMKFNGNAVARYFMTQSKNNWNKKSVCAVLGNFVDESNINPKSGEVGGGGYGLAQWTPKSKLIKWAKKIKQYKSYDTMYTQLCVIEYDARHGQWGNHHHSSTYYMDFDDFVENKGNHNIEFLTRVWENSYEGAGSPHWNVRIPWAEDFADIIKWDEISRTPIDDFLEWCKKIADNNDYTYQLGANHGVPWDNDKTLKKFDCSSFVSFGLHNGGGYDLTTQFSTGTAKEDLEQLGFDSIKYNSAKQLKRGDILLTISNKHVEVVYSVGNGGADEIKLVGAHDHYPTHPQDDIDIENFYSYNWEWILRSDDAPSSKPRENPTNSNKNKHKKAPINTSQNCLPPIYLKRRRRGF